MKHPRNSQTGFGHIGILLLIVVLAAVGGAGWWVWHKNQTSLSPADKAIQTAIKNAKCDYDDKDLCKFFTGWKAQKYYTLTSVSESDGKKTNTTMKIEGTDKYSMKIDGEISYEVIKIGNTTYTKAADGTWWKQVNPKTTPTKVDPAADLTDPGDTTDDAAAKISYKKIGKEKCGELTCFKYQTVNPGDTATTSYLWFDDQDYQLRRTQTVTSTITDTATYSYGKVSITAPSPVKELNANQYLVPGQSEPVTLPATGDSPSIDELMQQYGNQ